MDNQIYNDGNYGAINESAQPQEPKESCSACLCNCFSILLWLIFGGGFIMLLFWYLFGLIASLLLIPLPNTIHLFKISSSLILPSTRYTDVKTVNLGCCGKISRFFWIVPFGIILGIFHIIFMILYSPLKCCGCYWSKYHRICLSNVLYPGNKIVINMKINKFNFYTKAYEVVKNVDSLSNKVCVITGCNSGIGKETAKQLYAKGCIVVMACRNQTKAKQAKDDIIKEFNVGNPNNLQIIILDLGDLKSIDEFIKNFADNKIINGKLDYLINNAGVMFTTYGTTNDGLERIFGVNHMGHFYLVNKLLPILKNNKTRIINVSSAGHYIFSDSKDMTDWLNNLTLKGPTPDIIKYNGFKYYGISKLCNVLFTRQLNELYNKYGIVSLCLNPGNVPQTDVSRNINRDCKTICAALKLSSFSAMHESGKPKSIPQGAATTLRCVTITNEEIFGDKNNIMLYFDDCIPRNDKIHKEFINGQNTEIDQSLWDYSCKIIKSLDYLELNE